MPIFTEEEGRYVYLLSFPGNSSMDERPQGIFENYEKLESFMKNWIVSCNEGKGKEVYVSRFLMNQMTISKSGNFEKVYFETSKKPDMKINIYDIRERERGCSRGRSRSRSRGHSCHKPCDKPYETPRNKINDPLKDKSYETPRERGRSKSRGRINDPLKEKSYETSGGYKEERASSPTYREIKREVIREIIRETYVEEYGKKYKSSNVKEERKKQSNVLDILRTSDRLKMDMMIDYCRKLSDGEKSKMTKYSEIQNKMIEYEVNNQLVVFKKGEDSGYGRLVKREVGDCEYEYHIMPLLLENT